MPTVRAIRERCQREGEKCTEMLGVHASGLAHDLIELVHVGGHEVLTARWAAGTELEQQRGEIHVRVIEWPKSAPVITEIGTLPHRPSAG